MKGYELLEELRTYCTDSQILDEIVAYLSDDELYEALEILADNC